VDDRHIGYIFKNSFEKHCAAAAKSKRLKLERESKLQLMSNLNAEFEEALKEERGVEARSLAPSSAIIQCNSSAGSIISQQFHLKVFLTLRITAISLSHSNQSPPPPLSLSLSHLFLCLSHHGTYQCFFFQFVNKGGLAIIHKRTFSQICLQVREKSLGIVLYSCDLLQRFVKIWRIQIFFPHDVAILGLFPPKTGLCNKSSSGYF
jgi:hypothetical protein